MKKYLLSSIALCLVYQVAQALPEKPAACPSVATIKSTAMTKAVELFDVYFTTSISRFNTNQQWMFTMGPVVANSESKALEKAGQLINNLSGSPQPQNDDSAMEWSCRYQLPGQMEGLAVTSDDIPSPFSWVKSLLK